MSATVTIARRKDNLKAIHIDDVVKGRDKDFDCPGCCTELIAVKGDQKDHHFRHKSILTNKCRETALHLLAKQILVDNVSINYKTGRIEYQNAKAEQPIGKYKADVSAISSNGAIHFEVIVTHDFLDTLKEEYYRSKKIRCLKIDLSDETLLSASSEEITIAVLEAIDNKEFLKLTTHSNNTLNANTEPSLKEAILGGAIMLAAGYIINRLLKSKKKKGNRYRYK